MLSQSCSTLYIVYITSSPGLTDQNKTRYNTMCIFIPRSYPTCKQASALPTRHIRSHQRNSINKYM